MLFDTHAHLDDEQLADVASEVIEDARAHDVNHVLTVSTTLASCYRSVRLSETYPEIWAAVGIHPNSCHEANLQQWKEIRELVNHPRVVAVGETGLDGYWDFCPMDLQREYFLRHIELSHQSGLPFIVHMRECEPEMLETLAAARDAEGRLNGIMHSFCGSQQAADTCLDWGMHISFAGMVTYKKNDELRAIAATVPDDRLLIETDSPYLSPHPVRGRRPNTPAQVRHTLQCLADTRQVGFEELAAITTGNALRLFQINA